jgi:hypothetical protein
MEQVNVMSRAGQHLMGKAVATQGWEAKVVMDGQCMRELVFLRNYLKEFNGQAIRGAGVEGRTVKTEETGRRAQQEVEGGEQVHRGEAAYILKLDGRIEMAKEAGFKEDRGKDEKVVKELKAIQRYLREEGDSLAKSRVGKVFWRTSSFACACCLKMGSKVMEVQKELVAIKWLEKKWEVKVMGVWEDEDASTAELVQKLSRSTDEWGLDRRELAKVCAELHFFPDLDCMATRTSSVCKDFFTKGVCMQ